MTKGGPTKVKVRGEASAPKTAIAQAEIFAYVEGGGRIVSDAEGRLWHAQGKLYWQVFPAVVEGETGYVYY